MILKTVDIEDLDGNPLKRDYAFHMSASEALEFAHRYDPNGDIEAYFKNTSNSQQSIFEMMRDLLSSTVGKKHEDNIRFLKPADLKADFVESGAYDAILFEFAASAEKMIEFFNGVLPKNLLAKAKKLEADKAAAAKRPLYDPKNGNYSIAELEAMTDAEFKEAVGDDPTAWSPEVLKMAWSRKASAAA